MLQPPAVRTKTRVRVPLLYPAAAAPVVATSAAVAEEGAPAPAPTLPLISGGPQLDPALVQSKQAAARELIRDALGVGSGPAGGGAPAAAPLPARAAPRALPAAPVPAPAPSHGRASRGVAAPASAPAPAPAPSPPAALSGGGATPSDVASWLAIDSFGGLGLDARLVAKLTAPRQALSASLGGGGPGAEPGGRGHTRDGFGLSRPTRVQRLFIPPALAGRSLCAKSETGSGKTLAFLAPILHGLLASHAATPGGLSRASGLYAIVLAPTRELCQQIHAVACRLAQPFPHVIPGLVAGGEKRKAEKVGV